jgi:hypothetical protein
MITTKLKNKIKGILFIDSFPPKKNREGGVKALRQIAGVEV